MIVLNYLTDLKDKLLNEENWKEIELTRKWTSTIPSKAGVYALKHGEEIVYVGETGNLKGRMNDLLDSRHHTIRRTIGKILFSHQSNFIQATTKIKFPDKYEELLNKHICENLKIAYLTLELGRKELEELVEKEMKAEIKLNKRGKRKTNDRKGSV